MGMATPYNPDSDKCYRKDELPWCWATMQPGTALHHPEFKWIRFVTVYDGDPIFEYWELTNHGKCQKFSIMANPDFLKHYPEKDLFRE